MKRRILISSLVLVAAIAGIASYTIAAGGGNGPIRCPAIYAPVICDNGVTYPNQCEADRHHARNCVPTGDI